MLKITRKKTQKTLIFLHIPKAGGSTMNTIIARQFKNNNIFNIDGSAPDKSINQLKNISTVKRRKIKCLKGHLIFGIHRYLPCKCDYITMLRNPVDRVISHYYYVLQNPGHYLYKKVTSENINLKEYVENNIAKEVLNGQTRLLSGQQKSITSNDPKPLDLDDLKRAKTNLKKYFKVVGTTEKFDETLTLLKKTFGWNSIYYYKKNVNKNKVQIPQIDDETIEIIKQKNKLDMELYYFAQQLLNESIKNYGDSFYSDLSSFKKKNKIISKLLKIIATTKLKITNIKLKIIKKIPLPIKNKIKKYRNK